MHKDSWQFQLNFTLDSTLAAASDIWLVFDGIDTVGNVYLNEPLPPVSLDHCFTRLQHTLPNPRIPYIKQLMESRASCEQVSLADPLSAGFSMAHDSPSSQCWLYHNVSAISNSTGFQDGDFYCKVSPPPDGCNSASTGFTVRDQFLRYAFPVGNRLLREAEGGAAGGNNQLTVRLESVAGLGPGGIHSEWVGVRKEPSNFITTGAR